MLTVMVVPAGRGLAVFPTPLDVNVTDPRFPRANRDIATPWNASASHSIALVFNNVFTLAFGVSAVVARKIGWGTILPSRAP